MELEYGVIALVFLLSGGVVLYIHYLLGSRSRRIEQRLLDEDDDELSMVRPRMLLGDLTPALAAQIPFTQDDRDLLLKELRMAGFYRPTALLDYGALRWVLTIVPLVAACVLALFVETNQQAIYCWIGGVVLAMLGYSLPRIYVFYRGRSRGYAIERGLPVAVDMLILCLSAGLNVMTSLQRVVKELYLAHPILAFELDIVRRQADLRTLDFALMQFAERTNLANVRNLAVILAQSENLGTDALATLREYADSMRTNIRQRADEMANNAPFKLLFPAYLMALGAAVLIISPTVLEFNSFRESNLIQEMNLEARKAVTEEPTTTTTTGFDGGSLLEP